MLGPPEPALTIPTSRSRTPKTVTTLPDFFNRRGGSVDALIVALGARLRGRGPARTDAFDPAATLNREARLAGIRARHVSLEAIEGRRTQIFVVVLITLGALAGSTGLIAFGEVAQSSWLKTLVELPAFRFAPLVLTASLGVYISEKEVHLRRLTRMLMENHAVMAELAREARHDPLTNLANRTALLDWLDRAAIDDPDSLIGLIFIDLDEFKCVNDRHGHAAGDTLLQAVAERLGKALRRGDLVARIGGDEFALVAGGVTSRGDLVMIAERILAELAVPVDFGDETLWAGASIGMTLGRPSDGSKLLREADLAMYAVKSDEARRWAFFDGAVDPLGDHVTTG